MCIRDRDESTRPIAPRSPIRMPRHLTIPLGCSLLGMTDIAELTGVWIAGDPVPQTRNELSRVLKSGDAQELADRMNGTLTFGTAGIRGIVEAGSNRMN